MRILSCIQRSFQLWPFYFLIFLKFNALANLPTHLVSNVVLASEFQESRPLTDYLFQEKEKSDLLWIAIVQDKPIFIKMMLDQVSYRIIISILSFHYTWKILYYSLQIMLSIIPTYISLYCYQNLIVIHLNTFYSQEDDLCAKFILINMRTQIFVTATAKNEDG